MWRLKQARQGLALFIVAVAHCVAVHGVGLCDKESRLAGTACLTTLSERSFSIRGHDMDAHRLLRQWDQAMA